VILEANSTVTGFGRVENLSNQRMTKRKKEAVPIPDITNGGKKENWRASKKR